MPESLNHRDEPDHDRQLRIPGRSRGQIEMSADFDAPAHDLKAEIDRVSD